LSSRRKIEEQSILLVRKGFELHRAGLYVEAQKNYEQALKINSKQFDALRLLGALFVQNNQYEKAIEFLSRALTINPNQFDIYNNIGLALFGVGKFIASVNSYNKAIELNPAYVDAHYNRANTFRELGQFEEAIKSYDSVVKLKADHVDAYYNRGIALSEIKRYEESIINFRKVIALQPQHAEAYNNLGIGLVHSAYFEEALNSYYKSINLQPNYAEAHNNLGTVLEKLGRTEEALNSYNSALKIKPTFSEAYYNRGNLLFKLKNFTESIRDYKKVVEINPRNINAHYNLGNTLQELGRHEDAINSYDNALEIEPTYEEVHFNRGNALKKLRKYEESLLSYSKAIEINPNYSEAYNNRGTSFKELMRFEESKLSYDHAIKLNPDYCDAYINRGLTMIALNKIKSAISDYKKALEIDPLDTEASSSLLFTLNYLQEELDQNYLSEAVRYGELVRKKSKAYTGWENTTEINRCLKIGFISGDFRIHPVGYFIVGVIESLKLNCTKSLKIFGYYNHNIEDAMTRRIKSNFDEWVEVSSFSDEALATKIRNDQIDILIDLSGHTAHNRLPVFGWKSAPVQATWLGYFSSTGVKEIDYLIADPWVAPKKEDRYYTENIWRLPETYLCFSPPQEIIDVQTLPAIANRYFTFGSFNNLAKMNESVLMLWAKILNSIPESKLYLKNDSLSNEGIRTKIIDSFAAFGIVEERLILEGKSPRSELLSTYLKIDVALDTFPYPGGTTSFESLWMGVPVLTKQGDRFLSRIGETIMNNAGLQDWVAKDDEEYLSKAIAITKNIEGLSQLRKELRQKLLTSPLCDSYRFSLHFEDALRSMWTVWCTEKK